MFIKGGVRSLRCLFLPFSSFFPKDPKTFFSLPFPSFGQCQRKKKGAKGSDRFPDVSAFEGKNASEGAASSCGKY
jgi:hypothetical protein